MHRPQEHLDAERAELYALARLPEEDLSAVEEHLLICDDCRAKVDQAEEFATAMRSAAREMAAQPAKVPWWTGWFRPLWLAPAVAAALILLAVARWPATTAPFALHLTAMRGVETSNPAPARTPLVVYPDLTGLPANEYSLELVDSEGGPVWSGNIAEGGTKLPALSAGTYFLRVRGKSGETVREYAIGVSKKPAASNAQR